MSLRLRQLVFGVFLVFSVLFWNTLQAASGPAMIIDLTSGCDSQHPGAERTTLATLLAEAGYTVTSITTGIVPADLTGQEQVWDIRCQTALTPAEIAAYTAYLASGGSLFLIGENTGYGAARDASLISYIATLGGGSLTLTSPWSNQTVQTPFNSRVSTVPFRALGGTTTAGTGAFITKDIDGSGGGIVFGPGSLSSAPNGTLMIVWDINFLDNDAAHTARETALAENLIAYLAAPTSILIQGSGNGIASINGTLIIGGSASSGGGAGSSSQLGLISPPRDWKGQPSQSIESSSGEYKTRDLTTEEAIHLFRELNSVTFAYKGGEGDRHMGFVAEEEPERVATKDRKGLSPTDIVAVLTKMVQEQQKTNQEQYNVIKTLTEKLTQLEAKIEDLQSNGNLMPILSQKR